jgi:uncharacterized protein
MIAALMRLLSRIPLAHPRAVIVAAIVLTVAASVFLPRLHVSTDRNLLSGRESEVFTRREEVNRMFGTSLSLVVVLRGSSLEELKAAAGELAGELGAHPDDIRDVFYQIDLGFFEKHGLLFAPPGTLAKAVELVNEDGERIGELKRAETLAEMIELAASQLECQPVPEGTEPEQVEQAFDLFGDLLADIESWFERSELESLEIFERFWKRGPAMTGSAMDAGGYLVDADGEPPRLVLMYVQPAQDSQAMEVVAPITDKVRRIAHATASRYDDVEALVTGMPALATDELRLVTRDCIVAGAAAGIGVLLVFLLAFRSFRISTFVILPLGVGLIWSAGLTGALYGHLTMITSYFAAVLFGLGVAFTIHVVQRFHEALRRGSDKREAVEISLLRAGPGVMVGGVTTSVAFFAIAFSDFQGFSEFGVIAGAGTALILAANLTLLPAALLLWHPGLAVVERVRERRRVFWVSIARSRIVLPILTAGVLVAGAAVTPRVGFDYAVESMLPEQTEGTRGIRLLDEQTDFSMTYSTAVADSLAEAERIRRSFEKLPSVSRAEAVSQFIPGDQQRKLEILARVDEDSRRRVELAAGHIGKLAGEGGGALTAERLAEALQELADTLADLEFDAKRTKRAEAPLLGELSAKASAAVEAVRESGDDDRARELQDEIFTALDRGLSILGAGLSDAGFGVEDLPEAIRSRYVSRDGERFAVIAYPAGDLSERESLYTHADELLSVDPQATGHAVTHRAFTEMVHEGFVQAVVLAGVAVLLLILLDLRSPLGIFLAVVPVVVAAGCTVLVMYLAGIKWNYANLMGLPILIGTGVDYGVHLAHRVEQEGSIRRSAATTGKAIALAGVTTLIGFGSLLLGNHWGVRSLGLVLVIGIFASLLAALVVLPGLLRRREKTRQRPGGEG